MWGELSVLVVLIVLLLYNAQNSFNKSEFNLF